MRKVILLLVTLFYCHAFMAQGGYDLKCGNTTDKGFDVGPFLITASSYASAKAQAREIGAAFKAYYASFPEAAKALFNCDNQNCRDVECIKSVSINNVYSKEPVTLGNGKYNVTIRVHANIGCSDCDDDDNPPAGTPEEDEEGSIDLTLYCDSEQGAAFPFRTKCLVATSSDEAEKEAEDMKKELEKLFKLAPGYLNVNITCENGNCPPNESCTGSYSFNKIEILGPTFDGEKYSVTFIARIKAKCSLCADDPEPNGNNRSIVSQQQSILLSPNPAKENLTIEFINYQKYSSANIKILNQQGQTVFVSTLTKQLNSSLNVDVSEYPVGTYYVMITSNEILVNRNSFNISR